MAAKGAEGHGLLCDCLRISPFLQAHLCVCVCVCEFRTAVNVCSFVGVSVCVCVYMCFVLFVHDGGNKLYLMRKETKITDIPGNVAHRALCFSVSLYLSIPSLSALSRVVAGVFFGGATSFIGRVMNSRRIKLLIENVCCSGWSC